MKRARLFVPLAVFVVLLAFLYRGFGLEDPHILPSPMIGKPFPSFSLPSLEGDAPLTQALLRGRPTLVNVWATWCPTCKAEHAELMRIREDGGVAILGVVYKDDPDAAREWLARYGNPYVANVMDSDGRLAIDLGVYGAPESFLVDAAGVVVYKRVGDVNRRIWDEEIAPLVSKLRGNES
jgi:cytochrome c biogenesis protein CcmG/thiol:disulfide interchange protein DsbE